VLRAPRPATIANARSTDWLVGRCFHALPCPADCIESVAKIQSCRQGRRQTAIHLYSDAQQGMEVVMQERMSFNRASELFLPLPQTLRTLGKEIRESSLDIKLVHLLEIRASQINGCAFCM